jgi:hypothetical protein
MKQQKEKRAPKAQRPPKANPKFTGKVCELCGREYKPHPTTGKYPRFITHHCSYEPEITAVVCLSCHNWMSGTGPCYSHPLKPRNMTPEQRALGPATFAAWVVQLYYRKLYAIAEEQRVIVMASAIKVNDTTH